MTMNVIPGFTCVTLDRPMGFGHRSAACATWESDGARVWMNIIGKNKKKFDDKEVVVSVGR